MWAGDVARLQETTLGAEVYQAAALTKPQAEKLLSLYQTYKLEVNGLAQKREVLTSSLCILAPELEAQLNEEVNRQHAAGGAAVRRGAAPAGSQTTGSSVPTGAGSEAPGAPCLPPNSAVHPCMREPRNTALLRNLHMYSILEAASSAGRADMQGRH